MMNVYDDVDERGSVRHTDSQNQCEDATEKLQSAYNEIPICPTADWCQAAAFRFNLPGCEVTDERNEYLAFIIPRKKQEKKSLPSKPVEHEEHREEKHDKKDYYVPQHIPNCRWNTEYSSTIDDCARRLMSTQPKCKRLPMYPKNCCLGNTSERPPSPCYKTQQSRPIYKDECYPVKCTRRQDFDRNVSPQRTKPKQLQVRQKTNNCGRPLMIEPVMTKPIAYANDRVGKQITSKAPEYCSTQPTPFPKCIPVDESSSRDIAEKYESMQRSTGRPMPRCTFKNCK